MAEILASPKSVGRAFTGIALKDDAAPEALGDLYANALRYLGKQPVELATYEVSVICFAQVLNNEPKSKLDPTPRPRFPLPFNKDVTLALQEEALCARQAALLFIARGVHAIQAAGNGKAVVLHRDLPVAKIVAQSQTK